MSALWLGILLPRTEALGVANFLTTPSSSSSSSSFICLFYFNNDFGHTPKSVKPTHTFSLSTRHGHAFSITNAQPLAALVASDDLPVASSIFQAHSSMLPSPVYVVPARFLQRHHVFAIRAAEQANSWNRGKKKDLGEKPHNFIT